MSPAGLRRRQTRRKIWLKLHLYLGLSAGAIVALAGVTGAILVFYEELQEILNRDQIVVVVPAHPQVRSLDEMVAAADSLKPPGSRFFKVYYPRRPGLAYKLLYYASVGDEADGDGYYLFVDPYTAQVTGRQLWHPAAGYWRRPLVSFIMQLHYCMLLDRFGVVLVGIVSALSLVSLSTGLVLWWPSTGRFTRALAYRRRAGWVRRNYDLHKLAGVLSFCALFPVLFSGVYFNLPEPVNRVVGRFSVLTRPNAWEGIDSEKLYSEPALGRDPISFQAAEAAVNRAYPGGRLWMLTAPTGERGVFRIAKRDAAELSGFALGYRDFAVDQYSGRLLQVYEAGRGSYGDVFLDWQWPIHSGQALGWSGRIAVFASGLACPLLYLTGVLRWLQKRRAAHAREN